MKKSVLLFILFVICVSFAGAQDPDTPYLRQLFEKDTTYLLSNDPDVKFPIRGKVKISQTGFVQYMQIEFWIYDATGREIYYANHAAPTSASTLDKYIEMSDRMVEREYAAFMRRQGKMLFFRKGYEEFQEQEE